MYYIFEHKKGNISVLYSCHTEQEAMSLIFEAKSGADPEKKEIIVHNFKNEGFSDQEIHAIAKYKSSLQSDQAVKIIISQMIIPRMGEKGLNNFALSKMTGISHQTIGRWMKGEQEITLGKFMDILKALEINPLFVPKELDTKDYENRIFFN